MTVRIIAEQLAHPKGLLGRCVAKLMNRHNAAMNAFAVKTVAIEKTDRVLEIGFGGGVSLPVLLRSAAFVCGVDRSRDVVRAAGRRFHSEVMAGRAMFRCAEVEDLPLGPAEYDTVCTVNTIYFWRSLASGFAQIHRVLKPGGRVAVGFLPAEGMASMNMPSDIFTLRNTDAVVNSLANARFRDILVARPTRKTAWNTIIATR